MKKQIAPFAEIPAWTYQGKTPGIHTFLESIALAGLENKTIKLHAGMQRTLLGYAVFGRREIKVFPDGSVYSSVNVAFGNDYEFATWPVYVVRDAAKACQQLCPKSTGAGYYMPPIDQIA